MSTLLYTFVPILTAVFGLILIKETLSRVQLFGLFLGFFGITMLLYSSLTTSNASIFGTPLGNIILLFAIFSWSLYPIGARSLKKQYKSLTILFVSFLSTAAISIVAIPFELRVRPFSLSSVSLIGLVSVIGAILFSLVFYGLFQWLVANRSAFIASLVQYGAVVSGIIGGIIFFHDKLTIMLVISSVFIVIGVFLATTYQQLRKR